MFPAKILSVFCEKNAKDNGHMIPRLSHPCRFQMNFMKAATGLFHEKMFQRWS